MQPDPLLGPCVCDSRYEGCDHSYPCGLANDGTERGPWCEACNPRRLDAIRASLVNLRRDFAR